LAQKWLTDVFLPETEHLVGRRLLILDGHGSHCKAEFVARCLRDEVDLIVLPSHSSHKTQPLDVGIFQPLKKAMGKMTDMVLRHNTGPIPKWVWITNLARARKQAFTQSNIMVGWKETGIYPFRPSKVVRYLTPPPSTPLRTAGITPVPSLASDTRALLSEFPILHTPSKRHLIDSLNGIITMTEETQARNIILENELKEIQQGRINAKQPRKGANVASMGTHIFTTHESLGQLVGLEWGRMYGRKGKGREAAAQTDTEGGLGEDIPEIGEESPYVRPVADEDENPFL
jgi:hypothetical protein